MAMKLAVPAFLVVAGVFVAARLFDVHPWTATAWDSRGLLAGIRTADRA
jgi:hypothetical protein